MNEIAQSISQEGIAFAVLILVVLGMGAAIVMLWKELRAKDKYVSEMDRKNLEMLVSLTNVLDKISEDGKRNFSELREHITTSTQRVLDNINASK